MLRLHAHDTKDEWEIFLYKAGTDFELHPMSSTTYPRTVRSTPPLEFDQPASLDATLHLVA